jgi:hypothetical protein
VGDKTDGDTEPVAGVPVQEADATSTSNREAIALARALAVDIVTAPHDPWWVAREESSTLWIEIRDHAPSPILEVDKVASGVIANGYLRLDPQEWVRAVEKRRAALVTRYE